MTCTLLSKSTKMPPEILLKLTSISHWPIQNSDIVLSFGSGPINPIDEASVRDCIEHINLALFGIPDYRFLPRHKIWNYAGVWIVFTNIRAGGYPDIFTYKILRRILREDGLLQYMTEYSGFREIEFAIDRGTPPRYWPLYLYGNGRIGKTQPEGILSEQNSTTFVS